MKYKLPVKMLVVPGRSSGFQATVSLDFLRDNSRDVGRELTYLEMDYANLVNSVRGILSWCRLMKKPDPRSFWLIGDSVVRFLERLGDLGFYIVQQTTTLARDMGISKASFGKIICFRRRFPNIDMIDPAVPWSRYRENKVPIA